MTKLTVNNEAIEYRLDPATPLLWALRDASNLTGAKYGCGTGSCGACTVDIDGRAVRSCQVTIAAVEGSFVTTVEGLSRDRANPVQLALIADNVVQCGYCIPGIVMAAAVLIKNDRDPSEAKIKQSITNICRCGIYPRLVEAIQRAARAGRGDEMLPAGARPGIDPAEAAKSVPALSPAPSGE
ncbi:(2Fe-2S)-binding protein [Sphingomonas radiodurans]|uniref:(2Fe-2S)-binding protein n=1 Tax=Sphingomonas radiodurans TaxID=2890321 RepID=UPI001E2F55F5|nr:(2Fe-2S)-binding protein [Sphingomonas radiodurans]WBH16051.1 (2Fe-2S)-binding protein [Sphingomonas radiodurans]